MWYVEYWQEGSQAERQAGREAGRQRGKQEGRGMEGEGGREGGDHNDG